MAYPFNDIDAVALVVAVEKVAVVEKIAVVERISMGIY